MVAPIEQLVGSYLDTNQIFEGLIIPYIVPSQYFGAVEAALPATTWKVDGAMAGVDEKSIYLKDGDVAVKSTMSAELADTLTAGCQVGVAIHQIDTGDEDNDTLYIEVDAQSGDTLANCIDDLKAVYAVALAGAGDPGTNNGRIYTQSRTGTLTAIGAGLSDKYGALAAGASPIFKLEAAAVGAGYDFLDVTFYVNPVAPTVPTLNSFGAPQAPGIQGFSYLGEEGLAIDLSGTEQLVRSSQSREPIKRYTSGSLSTITFNVLQDTLIRALEVASGLTGRARTNNYNIAVFNLRRVLRSFGMIFTVDSLDGGAKKDIIVVPRVSGIGFKKEWGPINKPVAVTVTAQPIGNRLPGVFHAVYEASIN